MVLGGLLAPATAGNVAVVASASGGVTGPNFTDPQMRIMASGYFGQVDIIDAAAVTPTLAQLQMYDAVLVWTNTNLQNSVALGDVLADYVDAGGGVVLAVFVNCTTNANRYLLGRWVTGNYQVLVQQGGTTSGSLQTLGTVHVPGHPIMAGVATFSGSTSSWRPTSTTLTAGSTLIAEWSDGKMLVAQHGTLPNRVDLGFYPPSNAVNTTGWDATTDGGKLLANALLFVGSNHSSSTSFCSGDGSATACPCGNAGAVGNGCASSVSGNGANLATTGTPSLSADTLVLAGTGMPSSSALYFQGTTQFNAGLGATFGDGLRCAGGSIVRLRTTTNVSGASQFPSAGDPSVSLRGMVTAPGTRTYQVWYRNAAAFCTPSTFNLSNGVEVNWQT
jgi:hypothetical protein